MKKIFLLPLIFIAISCFSIFFCIHMAEAEDTDADGIPDGLDNCPYTPNSPSLGTCTGGPLNGRVCVANIICQGAPCIMSQVDSDGDGIGDACEDDFDADGVLNEADNCSRTPNGPNGGTCIGGVNHGGHCSNHEECPIGYCGSNQEDFNGDGIGDVCQTDDSDVDGVPDSMDNCPQTSNFDQADRNVDGVGDACDCNDFYWGLNEFGVDCGGVCSQCMVCGWCNEYVAPIWIRGSPNSGQIDVVFVPQTTYDGHFDQFLKDVKNAITDAYFNLDAYVDPIPAEFRNRFNFYYYTGGFGAAMGQPPENFWARAPFTDVLALLQNLDWGGGVSCCNPNSELEVPGRDYGQIIHESGHGIYNLDDEYCGNTAYGQKDPAPNVWTSLENCQNFANDKGWDPTNCVQIENDNPSTPDCQKPYWRYDGQRCFMHDGGLPVIQPGDVFGPACVNRINYVYENWPQGETRGVLMTFHIKSDVITLLRTEIVDGHPDIGLPYGGFTGHVFSSAKELLKHFGVMDPRIRLGAETPYVDDIDFWIIVPFYDNVKTFEMRQNDTGQTKVSVDLTETIRAFCASNNYTYPECQKSDLDNDKVLDQNDKCFGSNIEATIRVAGCDSKVGNNVFEDGCTMSDLIGQCRGTAKTHGKFVSCVSHLTNSWKRDGLVSGKEKGAIESCAAKSNRQ